MFHLMIIGTVVVLVIPVHSNSVVSHIVVETCLSHFNLDSCSDPLVLCWNTRGSEVDMNILRFRSRHVQLVGCEQDTFK